jgi:hypothetical protein
MDGGSSMQDEPTGARGEHGGQKAGFLTVNDLTYVLEPDLSVAVNRTFKKHFFQSQTYNHNQRAICIVNSGADYIDTRRSYLSFELSVGDTGNFGKYGSACNVIDSVTISTRSGDELCQIREFALLQNMMQPLTYDSDWYAGVGQLMGVGENVTAGAQRRFLIPLYILSPFFAYGRLMPAMLMSGLRIEIEWTKPEEVLQVPHAASSPNTSCEINLPYFNLCSVQLSDSIQRALNEQSATNGLEIVYCDYDDTSTTLAKDTNRFHCEVRKACSRALKAFARLKYVKATNKNDSFRAEAGFPFTQYQWQLGSLYFPQQPVKTTDGDRPDLMAAESFAHVLDAVDKFHGEARAPVLGFNQLRTGGTTDSKEQEAYTLVSGADTGRTKQTVYGKTGTYVVDQHVLGVGLERTSLFNLAGVPINNSRVLSLNAEMAANTLEDATAATDKRHLTIFLKYVKMARVFMNNVEVEQ